VKESCRREISAVFAHAAQETGKHDAASAKPEWQQAFYYMREQNSYDTNKNYDPPPNNPANPACSAPFVCPSAAHYYGRGINR